MLHVVKLRLVINCIVIHKYQSVMPLFLPFRIRMEHLTAITQEEANSLRKKEVAGKWHPYSAQGLQKLST